MDRLKDAIFAKNLILQAFKNYQEKNTSTTLCTFFIIDMMKYLNVYLFHFIISLWESILKYIQASVKTSATVM
jgi:hypothetical protein